MTRQTCSWLVTFSLGWGTSDAREGAALLRELPAVRRSISKRRVADESWQITVRSDSAAGAVHALEGLLGPERSQRLIHISATQDTRQKVRASVPWQGR